MRRTTAADSAGGRTRLPSDVAGAIFSPRVLLSPLLSPRAALLRSWVSLRAGAASDEGATSGKDMQLFVPQSGTVDVYGRIPGGQTVAPGSYTDTVTITLTF